MDIEQFMPGGESGRFPRDAELESIGVDFLDDNQVNVPHEEPEFNSPRTEVKELHSRIVELGKHEAQSGEFVMADMKPRWLACVLATMCAVEEHGRSEMIETS